MRDSLGTILLREAPWFCGFYLQEYHQILTVKIWRRYPPASGRMRRRVSNRNKPRAFSTTQAYFSGEKTSQILPHQREGHLRNSSLPMAPKRRWEIHLQRLQPRNTSILKTVFKLQSYRTLFFTIHLATATEGSSLIKVDYNWRVARCKLCKESY